MLSAVASALSMPVFDPLIDQRATWSPRSVPGLTHWYRGDYVTLVGSAVSSWTDISGRDNHAVQASGASRPTWVASGFNGRPVLRFSGGTAFLTAPGDTPIGARTYFYVLKSSKVTEYRVFDHTSSGSILVNFNPLTLLFLGSNNFRYFADNAATDDSLPHVWSVEFVGGGMTDVASARLLVGGVPLSAGSTAATVAPDAWGSLRIGAGVSRLDGDLAEFVVYNRVVSAAERLMIEKYLKSRNGVA